MKLGLELAEVTTWAETYRRLPASRGALLKDGVILVDGINAMLMFFILFSFYYS